MRIALLEGPVGDRPLAALVLLLTGITVLACQDSLVKLMSPQTSFWQFQTLRSIGNLGFIIIVVIAIGGKDLVLPKNRRAVWLRAALMIVCMFCFYAGAPYLSIAQMAAGLYTYPLFVSMLAGPVLGERVGPWRITAMLTGLAGTGLILSPWDEHFSWVQVLPVLAGFFYAVNIMIIRRACRHESPLALAFTVGVAFVLSGVSGIVFLSLFPLSDALNHSMPFIAIGWPELTLLVFGFAVLCSVLNLAGNICLSRAYQTADSSWLAPMDFSYLVFASIWGKVLFDQWPTRQAVVGMVLIAAAGIVTAWRENVVGRRRAAAASRVD